MIGFAALLISALALPAFSKATSVSHGKGPHTPIDDEPISAMVVRGKFRCDSITKHAWAGETVKSSAVCDNSTEENIRFHESTPTGSMEIYVTNKAVLGFYTPGQFYYLDMTAAPA